MLHLKWFAVLCFSIKFISTKASNSDLGFESTWDNRIPTEIKLKPSKHIRKPITFCNMLELVNRTTWKAIEPEAEIGKMALPVDKVFVDFTYTDRCSSLAFCSYYVRKTQDYHMKDIGLFDIAYNFMIGDDGRVYIGRDFFTARAFDEGFNDNSLLIGFIGDYEDPWGTLPRSVDIAYKLIRCGQEKGYITNTFTIYEPVPRFCGQGPAKTLQSYITQDRRRQVEYKCIDEERKHSPVLSRNRLKPLSSEDNVLSNFV